MRFLLLLLVGGVRVRHGSGLAIEDHLLGTCLEMVVMVEWVMVLAQTHRTVLQAI